MKSRYILLGSSLLMLAVVAAAQTGNSGTGASSSASPGGAAGSAGAGSSTSTAGGNAGVGVNAMGQTQQQTADFARLDVNGDRFLSPNEISASAGLNANWQQMDTDHDGRISATEFSQGFPDSPNSTQGMGPTGGLPVPPR